MSSSIHPLCRRLLKVSTKASIDAIALPIPIAGPILKELIDIVLEQTNHMDQKLDKLIKVDYQVGVASLRNACDVNDSMRNTCINEARNAFTKASKVEMSVEMQAQSMLYVGICFTLLSQPKAALHWYSDAYQKGLEHFRSIDEPREEKLEIGTSETSQTVFRGISTASFMIAQQCVKQGIYGLVPAVIIGMVGYSARAASGIENQIYNEKIRRKKRKADEYRVHFLVPLEELLRANPKS